MTTDDRRQRQLPDASCAASLHTTLYLIAVLRTVLDIITPLPPYVLRSTSRRTHVMSCHVTCLAPSTATNPNPFIHYHCAQISPTQLPYKLQALPTVW